MTARGPRPDAGASAHPSALAPAPRLVAGSALVTGGGSGIGRAVALALAEAGAPVAVLDLFADGTRETVARIGAQGGLALALTGDASRADEVDRAVDAVVERLGPLGIVVTAAGILDGYQPADEMAPAIWEKVIAINLTGTFLAARRALAEMLPRGAGRIVAVASVAGLVGSGGGPAYTASKHGVVGLVRQLAIVYAERGITVNAVCPGAISTALRANSTRILGAEAPPMRGVGTDDAAVRAVTPAGRRGTVEEVAAAVRFLCSEEAQYVTGHTLVVDGGWTAR
jgi:NAD(P)-dependent dehydrogenase (short-subunit alcohol dehydrogenase family)